MKIIGYRITLKEPVRIVDIEKGKPGESACMSYIPGSTVRGVILNNYADRLTTDSEFSRAMLGGKVRYLNAYPIVDGKQLYPSPMGFYEGKLSDGKVENIFVKDDPTQGFKRSGVGEFAYIENDTVSFYSVHKKDMLGIQVSGKQIFRSVVLTKGQVFGGYVVIDDGYEKYADEIEKALNNGDVKIGSSVTAGLGSCTISDVAVVDEQQYSDACVNAEETEIKEITMILRSPFAMRNVFGEICGIDEEQLSRIFGTNVNILKQATSIVKVSGVNRTWRCRTPEITMYKAGSAFKMKFPDGISKEKLKKIAVKGIGINTSEGCGMVSFTDSFDKVIQKSAIAMTPHIADDLGKYDEKDIENGKKIAARALLNTKIDDKAAEYITTEADEELKGIKQAQKGIALNWAKNLSYAGADINELKNYIKHEEEKSGKEKQQSTSSNGKNSLISLLKKYEREECLDIIKFDKSYKIMGYEIKNLISDEELENKKFDILARLITYHNRKNKKEA